MSKSKPIGRNAVAARKRRAADSVAYRAEQAHLAQFEQIARSVIMLRAELGISQLELANRIGTSHSAISRLESGRHKTSVTTLQRVAEALEARLVVSIEPTSRISA